MNHGQLFILFLLMTWKIRDGSTQAPWTFKCPCKCDLDGFGRKRVTCSGGRLNDVPVRDMDTKTQVSFSVDDLSKYQKVPTLPKYQSIKKYQLFQVLVIMGSTQEPNDLTIGRIFQDFDLLEEVTIRHSQVPAIGDSTFWPGRKNSSDRFESQQD